MNKLIVMIGALFVLDATKPPDGSKRMVVRNSLIYLIVLALFTFPLWACAAPEPPQRPHWKYVCTSADTVRVPVAVLHEDDEYNPLVVLKVPIVFCVRRDSVWIEPELEKGDTLDAAMIPK